MARPDAPAGASPATLSIFNALLSSIAEEMGAALGRSALSPNIRERRDYSCAVFDRAGSLIAQAAHIPVHLGAMPVAIEAVRHLAPFAPGDLAILNDPYLGGTHLPDVTMVSPVFEHEAPQPGRLIGFVASRAHQADIGGMSPGSMPLARELVQEGLVIPPLNLYRRGKLNSEALRLILRNVRTPEERRGDLEAQVAAQRTGERRLRELSARYGRPTLELRMRELLDYGERLARAALQRIPEGLYEFEDALDDDGAPGVVPIRVSVQAAPDRIRFDFAGSAPQRPSSVNAVAAVTRSAVYYAVRCLMDADAPMNAGCFRPVEVLLPEGSIVSATRGHAVSAGNVETSQRIVDVVMGALAKALPEAIPAASSGTMNNIALGGYDKSRARPFAYYETLAGGAGAGPTADGLDGVHTHMTNTLNTPVEALEMTYPFRIVEYALREGSGGRGRHRGGEGLARAYEFLEAAEVTLMTERRLLPPWGVAGGSPGSVGRNTLVRAAGHHEDLHGKAQFSVEPGDVLRVETPGGGGWGRSAD